MNDNTWIVLFGVAYDSQSYCASDLGIVGVTDQADEKLLQIALTNPNHDYPRCSLIKLINTILVDKRNRLFSNNTYDVWKLLLSSV